MTTPHSDAPASVGALRATRRGLLLGGAGLGAAALLAACGAGGEADRNTVRLGSYQSDEVPRASLAAMLAAFEGGQVEINTLDHETFKGGINNYLQGNPDDVFTWFSGYRARFFAERGLVADLTELWEDIEGMPESMKVASSTSDGRQIFLPGTYYPWAVFYKPSVWEQHGWSPPTTKDELMVLSEEIQAAGMTPIAFATREGWEAMGTFDMLNLRLNGYDFHVSLMAGDEAWDGEQVRRVFDEWRELLPFHQEASLGRGWQEAAQGMLNENSAMYLMGMFIDQQWQTSSDPDDLDFFAFPEFDAAIGADVVEAPVDGYMMAAEPHNPELARELMLFLSTPEAINITLAGDPAVIGASDLADRSSYTRLQSKASEMVSQASAISQFLDRDTRPDFAATVISPALQAFIREPDRTNEILRSVEAQKASIFDGA